MASVASAIGWRRIIGGADKFSVSGALEGATLAEANGVGKFVAVPCERWLEGNWQR